MSGRSPCFTCTPPSLYPAHSWCIFQGGGACLCRHPPCKIHTVNTWRISQGGLRVRHVSAPTSTPATALRASPPSAPAETGRVRLYIIAPPVSYALCAYGVSHCEGRLHTIACVHHRPPCKLRTVCMWRSVQGKASTYQCPPCKTHTVFLWRILKEGLHPRRACHHQRGLRVAGRAPHPVRQKRLS